MDKATQLHHELSPGSRQGLVEVLVSDSPLVWREDVGDGVRRFSVDPREHDSLEGVVREAVFRAGKSGAIDFDKLGVVVDGVVYSREALLLSRGLGVKSVRIAPCPGDPGTILINLAIAAAFSAASALLAPRVHAPRAASSRERAPGFGRFSSPAVTGDTIPVVLGAADGYGGKVVGQEPGEGENGDQVLRLLVCYGHGPIQAIGNLTADADGVAATSVTGIKLQDRDIAQFPSAKVSVRMGNAAGVQRPIPGFDDTFITRLVGAGGTALRNTDGVERTDGAASAEAVTYTGLDPVDQMTLRVRFPAGLYRVSGGGSPVARTVRWRYRTRTSDTGSGAGAWTAWVVVTVSQGVSGEFFSAPLVDFTAPPYAGPFFGGGVRRDVQAERVTVEPATSATFTVQDAMEFDSVVERRNASNDYAGKAMLALELTAGENLTGVPQVTADIKGYKKCKVWDTGSDVNAPAFVEGYSENPSALAHTLMVNPVWGLGTAFNDSNLYLDKVAKLEQVCDEAVAVPGGGTRPRYKFGMVLDTPRADLEWVGLILSACRAELTAVGSKFRFVPDVRQDEPWEVYTEDDIAADEDGLPKLTITYEATTGGVSKPNQLVAQIASADIGGRPDMPVVWPEPGELWLSTEPLRSESMRLDGVTDPHQAMAHVVYLLKRIRGAVRSVSFTTTRDVPAVQPGDRFDLSLPDLGFGVANGVLAPGSTAGEVMLDQGVTLDGGESYTVTLTAADGSIETRPVVKKDGVYEAGTGISVGTPFSIDVETGPVRYAFGRTGRVVQAFICTRLEPVEGPGGVIQWQIDGVQYVPESHDEEAVDVPRTSVADFREHTTPPGPMLTLTAQEIVRPGDGRAVVQLTWTQTPADRSITSATRIFRRPLGTTAFVQMPALSSAGYSAQIGVEELELAYEFVAVAISAQGVGLSPSDPRHPVALVAVGAAAPPPPPPENVTLTQLTGNRYRLSWDPVQAVSEYQVLSFADSSVMPNEGAENGVVIGRTDATFMDLVLPTGIDCRFWVRSVSGTGRLSFTAETADEASPADPVGMTVKSTTTWDLSTDGTTSNLTWSTDRLRLDDPTLPGVWTSPEVDTATATACEVVAALVALNDAEDPAIEDVVFGAPSIEADQWGVVSGSGTTAVVGMLMPPFTAADGDGAQTYGVELRTHDGASWSPWQPLAHYTDASALLRKAQVRVTVARADPLSPYRPSLAAVSLVVCD